MGLVFNEPEVSQDADAADASRRALALKPDYEPAKERLDATRQKLVPLAVEARSFAEGLVQRDEYFQFYVSPFEALQIGPKPPAHNFEVDAQGAVRLPSAPRKGERNLNFHLDVKAVQRAKKRLLQEIDLNDGKVGWLDDCALDKARALELDDELHDETKRHYHWAVFQNKWLLHFLTRGDIRHFLYADDYFPQETLELLDEELEFRSFLSKPFARQYNLVLTRAIERRALAVVEVLFDGRRWVEPEDDDVCFEGAYKRADYHQLRPVQCCGITLGAIASQFCAGGWQPGSHRGGRAYRATRLLGGNDHLLGADSGVAPDCDRLKGHKRIRPETCRVARAGNLHSTSGRHERSQRSLSFRC